MEFYWNKEVNENGKSMVDEAEERNALSYPITCSGPTWRNRSS